MLADRRVTMTLPAKDAARAIAWYEAKLGLKPDRTDEFGTVYLLKGSVPIFMYETQFAGTAQHTMMSFDTANIEADVAVLRQRGVVFEDYDMPGLKTDGGIARLGPTRSAWFKDSEGNIIALVEGM